MFVDTSGLLSLFDHDDAFHAKAILFYRNASQLLTHNYILAEWVALANARKLPRPRAIRFAQDLLIHPRLQMLWVGEPLHQKATSLLMQRSDKSYSLCDAVSFLQMKSYKETEALTTDHHFEQEGFVRLLT